MKKNKKVKNWREYQAVFDLLEEAVGRNSNVIAPKRIWTLFDKVADYFGDVAKGRKKPTGI